MIGALIVGVLSTLTLSAVPVEVQGIDGLADSSAQLAPLLQIQIKGDSGAIPVAVSAMHLPAPDKPGDPAYLVLRSATGTELLRMVLQPADENDGARYSWAGTPVPVKGRLTVAAPIDSAWMRLTQRRKLSRSLQLSLIRIESGESVEAKIKGLKRPTGVDPATRARMPAAEWAAELPGVQPAEEPGHFRIAAGAWSLDRDLVVPATVTLHLSAGATLRLAPGRSIFAYGRLEAHGTTELPVTIEPAGIGPWGVVALMGGGASGSVFEGVRFVRGSMGIAGSQDLNGALNLIDADATLNQCRFEATRGEDAIHAKGARLTLRNVTFATTASDAVDIVQSTLILEGGVFTDIGDDAVDVGRGSTASIDEVLIQRAGGKGVSVGQLSRATVSDVFILEAGRGVSAFEGSHAAVDHTAIAFSRRGAVQAAGRKGSEPGSVSLQDVRLWRNGSRDGLKSERVTATRVREDLPLDLASYKPGESGPRLRPPVPTQLVAPEPTPSRPLFRGTEHDGVPVPTQSHWLLYILGLAATMAVLLVIERALRR
ncbi:MAG: hypothetical protein ACI9WU_003015 [Myxococcota bacterium]